MWGLSLVGLSASVLAWGGDVSFSSLFLVWFVEILAGWLLPPLHLGRLHYYSAAALHVFPAFSFVVVGHSPGSCPVGGECPGDVLCATLRLPEHLIVVTFTFNPGGCVLREKARSRTPS